MSQYLISVDWGTSNFRLRLLDARTKKVLQSVQSEMGVKQLFTDWQQVGGSRESIFLKYLHQQIGKLKHEIPKETPVCISGMASSSIGMRELSYANLPFEMNGNGLLIEEIITELIPHPIHLISGVCSENDVMRGEEVELIGLFAQNPGISSGTFILPGTHSKHIHCSNGMVHSFETFMTGELFELLRKHSILSNSLEKAEFGKKEENAFVKGASDGYSKEQLLHHFFTIRAKDLFGQQDKSEAYYYLSGLLIGNELSSKQLLESDRIFLCSTGLLQKLYMSAIQVVELEHKTEYVSPEKMEMAVPFGQMQILNLI